MDGRQRRALRGAAAAALSVFVAAWFHVASGGDAPTPLAVIASFVLASPVCVLLAGRRTRLWSLAVSVGLSQFLFHALFSLGAPSDVRFVSAGGAEAMPGMPDMHGMSDLSLHAIGGHGASAAAVAVPAMWVGHALAALITIVAIRRSERALAALFALAARFLVRALLLALAPLRGETAELPQRPAVRAVAQLVVEAGLHRRGPPVRFAL
jgi:hypothetical protein